MGAVHQSLLYQVGIDKLPKSLQRLIAEIGMRATVALVEACGGETLDIPKGVIASQAQARLESIVGIDAAGTLMRGHGGARLYVPRCADIQRESKEREIVDLFGALTEQMSVLRAVAHIASKYRLSDRTIERALKGAC